MRHINKTGLDFIKRHEGYVSHAYLCQANYLTIGYGHLCLEGDSYLKGKSIEQATKYRSSVKITRDEAEELLRNDLREAESAVSRLISVPLTENQFAALTSFTFNLGGGALQRSTLRRKLNRGEYFYASTQFFRWVYAGGRKLAGLVKRRREEYFLFVTPDY